MPSRPWGPTVSPRLRARSVSSGSGPSWSSRNSTLSAVFFNSWWARHRPPSARGRSRFARGWVCRRSPAIWPMASRILSTCSPLSSPTAWAAAVAASTGAKDSPVRARRGPSDAASASRRPASVAEMRHRIRRTSFQDLAPISFGVVSACNRVSARCHCVGSWHDRVSSSSRTLSSSGRVSISRSQEASASCAARNAATAT